ncbi:chromosomal replication initiator protein DnaA [Buchnera aphidicola]|uniref:chromosomal replication initiator protein DnaA n=1 Tax=Buchnera aphidicola TaxID=9 RepID=UPI00313EC7EE
MSLLIWEQCLQHLKKQLTPAEFSIWIRPLKAKIHNNFLHLYAPNNFVLNWIKKKYIKNLKQLLNKFCLMKPPCIILQIIPYEKEIKICSNSSNIFEKKNYNFTKKNIFNNKTNINKKYTFKNFIEGKTNQIAKYSAYQIANKLHHSYNPLFIYGNTGLGKTHLLHAIGNFILSKKILKKVIYIHSEKFVQNMVKSLKNNSIEEFKNYYRSVNILLIDDIQFFSKKERSQEELFHTFNTLFDGNHNIVLTSDCYPQKLTGVAQRLKSRFGWGVTVAIDPPDFKTRIAILLQKAYIKNISLPYDVAKFIAKKLFLNVRELEGALNNLKIHSIFIQKPITIKLAKNILKDHLQIQKKKITIKKIHEKVAEYYNITIMDLLSKKRSRSITYPRQIAISLTKKLTDYSLPEIGNFFGGRDHTTILHACRKIKNLKKKNHEILKDFKNLLYKLSL